MIPIVNGERVLPPEERRELNERLLSDVILPQRRRLQASREHTLISTGGDSGNLGEIMASLVSGVRGNQRKGKTAVGNSGDLTDGTEVKAYTVCETNIDFFVHGELHRLPNRTVVFRFTRTEEINTLLMKDIRNQVNSVSNNLLQVLKCHEERWIGSEMLYRTAGNALRKIEDGGLAIGITKNQLQDLCRAQTPVLSTTGSKTSLYERLIEAEVEGIPTLENGWYLIMRSETEGEEEAHFQYDESLFSEEHFWHFRKERSHINFGNKTRSQLEEILQGGGIAVCNFLDPRGRYTFAVFRFMLEAREIEDYLDQVVNWPSQVQPYLFADNLRTEIKRGDGHTLENLGARLMMLGHETANGSFSVVHMKPDAPPPLSGNVEDGRSVIEALTGFANDDECPSLPWDTFALEWSNSDDRIAAANEFFQISMAEFYRSMVPFCDLAGSPRNIGFGTYAEHLTSLVTGLKGTRSNARGIDLYELDGTGSDVKTAVGYKGDNMGTEDRTVRYDLMKNQPKMYGWKRWFPVRIVDEIRGSFLCRKPTLRASIFQMTTQTLELFHNQIQDFFEEYSENLQYHTNQSVRDPTCGPRKRRLTFSEMAYFEEGKRLRGVESLNDVRPDHRVDFIEYCQCPECRD